MAHTGKERHHYVLGLRAMPQIMIKGPRVLCVESKSRFSPFPIFLIIRLIKDLRNPIIHCHLFRSQVFGYIVGLLYPSVRLVFHEHGRIEGRENEGWLEHVLFRPFLRLASPRVDRFVAITGHTKKLLAGEKICGRRDTLVVHNRVLHSVLPLANAEQRTSARRRLGLADEGFVFGFAGRLIQRKGWREFVECAESYRQRSDVFWLVSGTGEDEPVLKDFIIRRQLTQIKYIGFLTDMQNFYRAIDCCVVPSHWESHGLVQIEAQSHGLPVIVTDVDGMNETVEGNINALFFTARDAGALQMQVGRILASEELRARLARAAELNAARYTIEQYNQELEACYRSIEGPVLEDMPP